jgi:hypothetical protein
MPRHKIENPRIIIVPIRLTRRERDQISKRAHDTPLSQWIRQAVFASLEKPPTEKPESPEIQPKHSPEQASKVQGPPPPPGEWAKHPGAYRKFKKYVGREPEACEWDSCLTESE